MDEKPIRHVDRTLLNTHARVEEVGNKTTVETIAFIAAVRKIAGDFEVKEGDQVEWKAELTGHITVTRSMLSAATEQLLQ